jgi:hypothetical protein
MFDFFNWVVEKLDNIERLIKKGQKTVMALPQLIQDAIALETAEGLKREELISQLQASKVQDAATIAALSDQIAAGVTDAAALQATIAELQASALNADEIIAAIAGINNSPVSDAVVTEVITNPEIETPAIVEAAPPVADDVVQAPEVVAAALEAVAPELA